MNPKQLQVCTCKKKPRTPCGEGPDAELGEIKVKESRASSALFSQSWFMSTVTSVFGRKNAES